MKIEKFNTIELKKLQSKTTDKAQESCETNAQDYMVHSAQIPFTAIHNIVPKLVNIDIEKSKLLRQISDILEFDTSELTKEQTIMSSIRQMLEDFRALQLKRQAMKEKIEQVINDKTLNKQQKVNILNQYKKELEALKRKPKKQPAQKPAGKTEERTDFQLMNKFKSALSNGNFNLLKVFKEYYADLGNITTLQELAKRYPKIKIPPRPEDVVAKKITDSLTRDFFEEFEKCQKFGDIEGADELINQVVLSACRNAKTAHNVEPNAFYEKLLTVTKKSIQQRFADLQAKDAISSVPTNRKLKEALISETDAKLLSVDFDEFVLSTHKRQYLGGERLNDIVYEENGIKIPLKSLSNTGYKMEKVSEKVRKMIADADKMLRSERAYEQFPPEKLKIRLEHFVNGPIGENDELLDLIVKFDSCRFEPDDITMLRKFLSIMDDVEDGNIDIPKAINKVRGDDVRPKGTQTLDALERQELEQKLKIEQRLKAQLNKLQNDFDDLINSLYINGLNSAAVTCSKYRPVSLDPKDTESADFIMKLIREHLSPETGEVANKLKLEESLSRWNTFVHYKSKNPNSDVFKDAIKIATKEDGSVDIDKAGQYILNFEKVDSYPESLEFVLEPEVLKKIMERTDNTEDAIRYLSRFDDYMTLPEVEKTKLSTISEMFNIKDPIDKAILKHIIENDYISTNTTILTKVHERSTDTFESVFAVEAKKQLLDEIPYPECIDYFKGFENALSMMAASEGATGIKHLTNNDALAHKIEAKIKGNVSRLFSSKNNYVFDIFSKDGLH